MIILCECGEFIEGNSFTDYIETSMNPSTRTVGHCKCGLMLDLVDGEAPRKYSSKKELKSLAFKLARKKAMDDRTTGRFLVEVDRIKSQGRLTDWEILKKALYSVT